MPAPAESYGTPGPPIGPYSVSVEEAAAARLAAIHAESMEHDRRVAEAVTGLTTVALGIAADDSADPAVRALAKVLGELCDLIHDEITGADTASASPRSDG